MRPRLVRLSAIFYGLLLLAAVVWNSLRGREPLAWGPIFPGLAFGLVAACVTIILGLLVYRSTPALRKIADELAPRLVDGTRRWDLVLISVFSGIGEEAFFRGALQPEVGLVATALIFGAAHIGPDRRYLVWTVWAVFAGFLFGGLFEVTNGILAPMVAHSVHNAATFLIWKRSRERIRQGDNP